MSGSSIQAFLLILALWYQFKTTVFKDSVVSEISISIDGIWSEYNFSSRGSYRCFWWVQVWLCSVFFENHGGNKRNLYTCCFFVKGESTGVIGNVVILVLKLQIWMDLTGKYSSIQATLVFQMDWLLIMGRRNSVGQTLWCMT